MNIQKQTWSFGLIALSAVFALFTVGTPLLGTAASSTADPSPATETPQADTVEVVLEDGAVELPSATAAGAVTFVVQNAGQQAHGFALSGPAEAQLDERLKAGQKATFTSELEAGSYDAYCPVEGHSKKERTTLKVE